MYTIKQVKDILDLTKSWLKIENTKLVGKILDLLNTPIVALTALYDALKARVDVIEPDFEELIAFQAFTYSNDAQSVASGVAITNMTPTVGININSTYITYTYAITAGGLPTGVTLNTGTGVISGTPTEVGEFTPTITVSADKIIKPAKTVSITLTITEA